MILAVDRNKQLKAPWLVVNQQKGFKSKTGSKNAQRNHNLYIKKERHKMKVYVMA